MIDKWVGGYAIMIEGIPCWTDQNPRRPMYNDEMKCTEVVKKAILRMMDSDDETHRKR